MNGVALNFDATNVKVEEGFEPLPAGWYNCTVTNTERKPAKSNPQNNYLEVVHTIMDGPYAHRKLFNRINLWNADPTAVDIAFKGASGLAALQQACGVFNCQSSTQLHGIPLKVKVKVRPAGLGSDGKQYDSTNDVVKYASINADVGDAVGDAEGVPPWAASAAAPATAPAAAPVPPAQPSAPPVAVGAAQPWAQPGAPATGAPPWIAKAVPAAPAAPAPAPAPQAPPPQAVPAGPVMLAKANGIPYESYRKSGWTDEQLVANGMMAPPVASPPPAASPTAATPASPAGVRPPWAT